MNVAGHDIGKLPYASPSRRVAWQDGWARMGFIQIFDGRERLTDHVAVMNQGRNDLLRIDRPVGLRMLLAAILPQVNKSVLRGDALQVQGYANAESGRRPKVPVEDKVIAHIAPLADRSLRRLRRRANRTSRS